MLTLYKAHSVREGTDAVLSTLKEGNGRNIIIVPDAFTLAFEAGALSRLGKEGSFDLEVMSFARLAGVVLGNKLKKCLSPAGSVMLLERVIRKNEKNLRAYGRAARKAGFAEEMYAALTAIRNSGVTAERLERAAESLQGYVRDKTLDIVTLYKAYLEELNLCYSDSTTRLEALIAEIEKEGLFGNENFYVLDHTDFNAKQLGVLRALMKNARSLTVSVSDPMGGENKRIYPSVCHKLRRIAEEESVRVEEVNVPCRLPADRLLLAEKLFAYGSDEGFSDAFSLVEAKDEEEEVVYLATEITRLVRTGEIRYRDVALIAPSFEEYRPHVERIFSEYGIPVFTDERYPLDGSDLFRHWIAAWEVCAKNADRNTAFRYVFHELFSGASNEEKTAFYDYALKYGAISFRSPFTIAEDDPLFPTAEKVRRLLLKETEALFSVPAKAPVARYAEAFETYLKQNEFDERILRYAERVYEAGFKKESEILRQTPKKTIELLESLREIRGEDELSLEDFILAFRSGASQVKIAALPLSLDCVYFASPEQVMFEPIKRVFIVGAEDGVLPIEKTKEGVLGEREYTAWRNQDIVIENVGAEELGQSRFNALQLLLRGEKTCLSHLASSKPSSCSRFLARTFSLTPLNAEQAIRSFEPKYRIPTRAVAQKFLVECSRKYLENTLLEEDETLAFSLAKKMKTPFPVPAFEAEQKTLAKGKKIDSISVSELETYFSCPYLHFVKYALNAKEKDVAKSDKRILGDVLHRVADEFMFDLMRAENRKEKAGEEIVFPSDAEAKEKGENLARKILSEPKYLAIAKTEGERFLERTVRSAGEIAVTLKNQRADSEFKPTYFEIVFDEKGVIPPLPLGAAKLKGKIDRIDLLGRNAVAIDYKTGTSDYRLKDVYFGKKIQLQMYLAVLENAGYSPTAALYADIRTGFKSENARFLRGQFLNEDWVALSIDQKIATGEGTWTGLSIGEEDLLCKAEDGTLLSREQMENVLKYVKTLSENAIDEMEKGFIAPYPLAGGDHVLCGNCTAKNVCLSAFRHKRAMIGDVRVNTFDAICEEEV